MLANDFETEVGGMFIRVRGESGDIVVGRKGVNESNAIVFRMESIEEVNANGSEVGRGRRGHSFKSFANKVYYEKTLYPYSYGRVGQKLKVIRT